jgi:hypothetical protein
MASMAEFQLVVLSNPAPGREAEYNSWYDTIHLPQLLQIPGIVSVKRLVATTRFPTSHRYLALYVMETDDPNAVMNEIAARSENGTLTMSDALGSDVTPMIFQLVTEVGATS